MTGKHAVAVTNLSYKIAIIKKVYVVIYTFFFGKCHLFGHKSSVTHNHFL